MDFQKALLFADSVALGATLLSLGESGATLDDIRYGVIGADEVDRETLIQTDTLIATYLDFIGVQEDAITDLFARSDKISNSKASAIVRKFLNTYNDDDVAEIAKSFSLEDNSDVELDDVSLDMVARKQGYRPNLVIRKNKKVWVNKRISKYHRPSYRQKKALEKARHKAHTVRAKLNFKRSIKTRKRYGLK